MARSWRGGRLTSLLCSLLHAASSACPPTAAAAAAAPALQPFKDTTVFPDPATGYSAERAMGSGGDVLEALLAVLPDLQQR